MNKLKYNLQAKNFKIRWLVLILSAGAVFIFFTFFWSSPSEKAKADVGGNLSANYNVYGWAWNDNYGWISMNHLNCDKNNNGFIDSGICNGNDNVSTPVVDHYGVNINTTTGAFTGYAWSDILGYIRFDPPMASAASTPQPRYAAILDTSTRQISGLARICSRANTPATCSGNNGLGWVKLRCTGACNPAYGLSLNKANQIVGFAFATSTFTTTSGIGWISFSSRNCDANNDGKSDGVPAGCPLAGTDLAYYSVGLATNVHGWAWNNHFGWINTNCTEQWTDGNVRNGCGNAFYGINIEPINYNFGGYGWSSNFGWVSFEENNAPSYAFNSNCLNPATCVAANNCTACINKNNNRIYGWAKIISLGDDGWVRLNDDNLADAINYGVAGLPGMSDFAGWALNSNNNTHGIGWVSFNVKDCDVDGDTLYEGNNEGVPLGSTPAPADCPTGGIPAFPYKVYTDLTLNNAPTGGMLLAQQRRDGTGIVYVKFSVNDAEGSDIGAKIEYRTGASCVFPPTNDPTLDTASRTATTLPLPTINNSAPVYQITGIKTNAGVNTVGIDWQSKTDIPAANGQYCVRVTLNDGSVDTALAGQVLTIDNVNPNPPPGNLTIGSRGATSVTLNFGAQSADSNPKEYKIYYKACNCLPTEADSVFSAVSVPGDTDLGFFTYNGTSNTTIAGLNLGTEYSFIIYAYDQYGNKASAVMSAATTTNTLPIVQINSPANDPQLVNPCSHILSELLSWTFIDPDPLATQSSYRMQIKKVTDPWTTLVLDQTQSTGQQSMNFSVALGHNIVYNQSYDYRVWVADNIGEWSALPAQGSFTTPVRPYPYAYFKYTPINFSLGEAVSFSDNNSLFFINPTTSNTCSDATCLWSWSSTPVGSATIDNPNSSSTIIRINPPGNTGDIILYVADASYPSYRCSTSSPINANKRLPSWIETK